LAVIGLVWGAFVFFPQMGTAAVPAGRAVATGPVPDADWTSVALELIKIESRQPSERPSAEKSPPVESAAAAPLLYRANPSRTGAVDASGPHGLKERWRFEIENAAMLSSPLIAGDAVFGAFTVIDPPSSYGGVFRLDVETGEERWILEYADAAKKKDFRGFFSSPALSADGGRLVIGQGLHPDSNVDLLCIDTATGALLWTLRTPVHFESSPVIDGNVVLVGAGAIEQPPDMKPRGDPAGIGNPGYVVAADLETGRELWRYAVNDPESSPIVADGVVFVGSGFNGKAVVALRTAPDEKLRELSQERLLWKTATPHPATGAVTLAGDLVLVGCGNGDYVFAAPKPEGNVIALDRRTGEIRWNAPQPDAVLGAVAVADGVAYAPIRNGDVVALQLATGKEIWRRSVTGRPIFSGPAVSGSKLYITTQDGYLAVLNIASGEILEKHYINSPTRPGEQGLSLSSPFVANGLVVVGSETGGVVCFGAAE
jgi:outer membrane protein assembly factor BamB